MRLTVSFNNFVDTFNVIRPDNFTYEGLTALWEYLGEYEIATGEEVELDAIALCCEYSEYRSAWDAMAEYQPEDMPTIDDSEGMDLVELVEAEQKAAHDWLEERTIVIDVEGGGVIINEF